MKIINKQNHLTQDQSLKNIKEKYTDNKAYSQYK